ncbi:MAG: alkene reductase [Haliea sp.]|jgi:N-ethylmaleimide reductase
MPKTLLSPTQLGSMAINNRVIMAPMTRARAPSRVPTASMAEYYRQRASAGLIITEATQISRQGTGTIATPGIHTPEQIAGWCRVTEAVHQAGGRIVCQIWHSGRVSHQVFHDGELPVAPSAVQGAIRTFTEQGFVPTPQPRALALEEIPAVVADFRQAAVNAMSAGFDGVEIHGANGYLIDQFLRDGVNLRTDAYGGSIENRCRFLLEVTDAVIDAIGADVTSVRLSPFSTTWDCHESNPAPLFRHAISELDRRELAFLEIVERINESTVSGSAAQLQEGFGIDDIRAVYHGALVLNGGYDHLRAEQILAAGGAAAISFGRPYLSTPDLVERFAVGAALNPPGDDAAVYGGGDAGYIDFPRLKD